MVKVLVTEQSLKDIGDAIREKNSSNEVYYPSEFSDAVLNIPTASGGLHFDTSLVLVSDVETTVTGEVVLTGTLSAFFDSESIDVDGFLGGATVNLYDGNDVLLDTGVTNDSGVVIFNETISGDTTFYCVFSGTSDYEACISNEVTVEYQSEILGGE